jgi:SAM-dependent methyltransferase
VVETPYSSDFFELQRQGSNQSAQAVVPLICELAQVNSVVDIGCGVGTWLAAFVAHGVVDVLGVDGDYVDREALAIKPTSFLPHDLTTPLDLGRRYDLAISLEVGEHLPPDKSAILVEHLVNASDLVVFSAAIPNQGGTDHINEQWPSWWAGQFARRGFEVFDVVRPRIWTDERIEVFYRQNMLLFAFGERAAALRATATSVGPLDIVHPGHLAYVERHRVRPMLTVRTLPREAVSAMRSAALRRIRR